jgi:hypothetical protein
LKRPDLVFAELIRRHGICFTGFTNKTEIKVKKFKVSSINDHLEEKEENGEMQKGEEMSDVEIIDLINKLIIKMDHLVADLEEVNRKQCQKTRPF